MKVAVLAESRPDERRVAIVPGTLKELSKAGVEVTVVSGAGVAAGFPDREYQEAGATVVPDAASALRDVRVVAKVQPPSEQELRALPPNAVLVSLMNPLGDVEAVRRVADAGVTAFALELIPRTTRAQSMDVLSSQATVAGYKAVLMGADHLPKLLPMLMTAAGTIRPGKVLVLGAGVAGLQAIATARRLGAKVEAFDVRPAVKEQVQSLGATFLETEHEVTAEGEGGYAKELSEEQHRKELELIARAVVDADVVITTAQIPGRKAPVLVTEAMLDTMRPGSVVVDLASETGGNCEATRMGETVQRSGVTVLGPVNLPATLPFHASQMFSKNVATFLKELLKEGELALDFGNDVVGPTCLTHGGEVMNARVREALGMGPPPEPAAPPARAPEGAADATTGTGGTGATPPTTP